MLGLFVTVAVAAAAQAGETSISVADGQVIVDGPGTFELPFVIDRGGELTDGVRILLETAEGGPNPATPGEDYTPLPPGTEVLLNLDETSTTVNVEVIGEGTPEPDETLLLQLTGAQAFSAIPRLSPTALHARVCCFSRAMAVADLNGDDHPDIITGNDQSWDVSVVLADGEGGFADHVNYAPQGNVTLGRVVVAVGDVTGDGHPDIVASGFNAEAVEVFAGDGSGGFSTPFPVILNSGDNPTAVAAVDVTGDDNLDILTTNGTSNTISVLVGDGAGGFAPAVEFPTGSYPNAIAVADATGDGNLDVVTANGEGRDVSVLAGDGVGGFAPPIQVPIGPDARPLSVAVADATGDGHLDLVTANEFADDGFPPPETPGSVSVMAGDGAGGFAPAEQLSLDGSEGRGQSVAVANVTGDGDADVVVGRPIDDSVTVLAGDGMGGFAPAERVPTGDGPGPVAVADMTGDGNLDVVVANGLSDNVAVLPGDGAGNVGLPGNYDAGVFPHSVTAADLDGDGHQDVATANAFGNDVSVLLNDGSGGLTEADAHAVGSSPTWITVGDIDGNDIPDLITANLGGGNVSVLLGDGAGGFADALNVGVGGDFESPYAVAVADVNGDGHQDIATANTNISNESISLLLGDGTGGFADPVLIQGAAQQPQSIDLADVTGDGNVDIVVPSFEFPEGQVALLAGDGNGGFTDPVHLAVGEGPVFVRAADVTGEGHPDLVSLNHTAQTVSVLVGDGAGGFAEAVHFPIFDLPDNPCSVDPSGNCPWAWGLAVADVTGDGHADIVTANTDNDTVSVLPNDGFGDFSSFEYFHTGALPGAAAVADVTGDGNPDVITSNRENDTVSVLASRLSRVELLDDEALGTIITDISGGGPVADITPAAFAFEVPQGGSESDTLNIGNIGDAHLTWNLEEAETAFTRQSAPYTYGLRGAPEFHAPVGSDRASGITRHRGTAPADPVVLAAPQPLAIDELAEDFDDIAQLPGAGWAMINNSEPVGPSSWFQGNDTIFPAHEGAPDAYIAANYESVDDSGTISNWLITPEVTIKNGTEISFWTRTTEQFEEFFDRLEVRMSVAGDSTDVGDTAESVGDFTELLLTVNPDLEPGEYPEEWTQFTLTVRGRSRRPVTGRFAFRYFVTDAGPNGSNGDYIGIDTVSVTQPGDGPPGGGCDDPVDIPWLAADPTSGTTAPNTSDPVNVTVDTTGLEEGEHTALLCVSTNDPNDPRIVVPLSLTVTPQGGASFEGLGDLSGGVFHSEANAVSADGSVVVGSSSSENADAGLLEAFRWQDGEMVGLGDLPGGDTFASQAFGVSADGSVVVGRGVSEEGGEAFRWEDGEMEGLGDLPGPFFLSIANAVSADGSVVVGVGNSQDGEEAFRWENGEMVGLGFLPGAFNSSQAHGVSADGSVVIGHSSFEAFRWQDGEMEGIGDLPGGFDDSRGRAVSADASVIAGASTSDLGVEAYRWQDGEMAALGDLDGGTFWGEALAASADGSVIVGFGHTESGREAFIWTADDGMRNLKEVLEGDYGLDLAGWLLEEARGISADGTVIVGSGSNPDGEAEAWRVTGVLPVPVTKKGRQPRSGAPRPLHQALESKRSARQMR